MFELPEQGTVFPDLEMHELMDDDLVPVFLLFPKEIDNDLICSLDGLVWNDPPDSATRLSDIAGVAGNEIHMGMTNGLSCIHSAIDADVESRSANRLNELPLQASQELQDGDLFVFAEFEEVSFVAYRNDQHVAG